MKKIGLIGCDYWGKNYIKTIGKIGGVQLTWIYNAYTEITDETLPQNSRFTKNYSDILRDKDTIVFIITTPAQTHYKIAKEALLTGKDVLNEKPVTIILRPPKSLFS